MNAPEPKACVIGHPISHSLSPVLHGGWLKDLALRGRYEALDVPPSRLGAAIAHLKAEGYRGANITIPHKGAVRAFLDTEDECARAIGAVNTLVIGNGRVAGFNSDAFGYMAHLASEFPRWRELAAGRPALVLGAGGAARGIIYGLAQSGVSRFLLTNRGSERAQTLAAEFAAFARIEVVAWEDRARAAPCAWLIVNATPLGMQGQGELDLDLSGVGTAIISDVVYNPPDTLLLRAAKARGLPTLDGLGMLIHQGRQGFAAWFGEAPPLGGAVRARLMAALAAR